MSGFSKVMKDSSSNAIAGQTFNDTWNSKTYNVSQFEEVGISLLTGTVTGTSVTLDITPQCSYDGGTTWQTSWPVSVGEKDGTAIGEAAVDTMTEASDDYRAVAWFTNWAVGPNARMRWAFTVGGSSEVIPIVDCWFMGRKKFADAV